MKTTEHTRDPRTVAARLTARAIGFTVLSLCLGCISAPSIPELPAAGPFRFSLDGPSEWRGPWFDVRAGHHECGASLSLAGVTLSPIHTLRDALRVSLEVEGAVEPFVLDAGWQWATSSDLLQPDALAVTLSNGMYPNDGMWLGSGSSRARFKVELRDAGQLSIDRLHCARSKWNSPLSARVMEYDPNATSPVEGPVLFPRPQRIDIAGPPGPINKLHEDIVANPFEGVEEPPEHAFQRTEGYFLDTKRGILRAGSVRALEYGRSTFRQLAVTNGTEVRIYPAVVVDYPHFQVRAVVTGAESADELRATTDALKELSSVRLSQLMLEHRGTSAGWWKLGTDEIEFIHAVQKAGLEPGVFLSPSLESLEKSSAPVSDAVRRLAPFAKQVRNAGAQSLFLRVDKFLPLSAAEHLSWDLVGPKDRSRWKTLARAHAGMIGAVRSVAPHLAIAYLPPWHHNEAIAGSADRAEKFYRGDPAPKAAVVWTGPVEHSLDIDELQARIFMKHTGRELPLLFDNSLDARRKPEHWGGNPARMKLLSPLEPYDVILPPSLEDPEGGVLLNLDPRGPGLVQLATAAAYLWNPDAYSPQDALWAYLVLRCGPERARRVLGGDLSELTVCRDEPAQR